LQPCFEAGILFSTIYSILYYSTNLSYYNMQYNDVYTSDSTTVLVRVSRKDFNAFNQNNDSDFETFASSLHSKDIQCFFQKIAETEYKITVPVLDGQLELSCQIHYHTERFKTYYSYQAIVEKRKKTVFKNVAQLPLNAFRETVQIKLCNEDDCLTESDEALKNLIQKVDELPIHIQTTIDVQQHQTIWFKWIEAQKALLAHLQKPYPVVRTTYNPIFTDKDKSEPLRYQVTLQLQQKSLSDYQKLERELKKHSIQEPFDADGSIKLTKDDLERVLDPIVQRDFAASIERKAQLSAILKIKNRLDMEMNQRFKALNYNNIVAAIDADTNLLSLSNGNSTKPIIIPKEILDDYALVRKSLMGVLWLKTGDKSEKKVFYASLDAVDSQFLEREKEFCKQDLMDEREIAFKAGWTSARFELCELYRFDASKFNNDRFETWFWNDLKRDFIPHESVLMCNENKSTISVDFETWEDWEKMVVFLKNLNKFRFILDPSNPDFKFKVKTQLLDRKSEQGLFQEQLETLRGAEFAVEIPKKERKGTELIYLGKLARESNTQQLVLNLPNIYPNDKKETKEALKFLGKNPVITEIRANLVGDTTKMAWLHHAILKITEPTDTPNGHAVNPALGDFIFDTAKATPIFNEEKVALNSTFYWDIRANELLKLNDSQRKAVLAAVYCKDLALLQGPPGTGKTTVIAEMIWQMLRKNPKHRILLTSETNLAVDNAIDRLLNTKGVNPKLARFTTLIKPLRFGRMGKMDESGAKYAVERILKWCNEAITIDNSEPDSLEEQIDDDDDDVQKNSPDNNAVQDWMLRIAERARHQDSKYSAVLKNWTLDLTQPTAEVKHLFKDKYFEYSNVVGSTCSSTGNPRFAWDVAGLRQNMEKQRKLYTSSQHTPFGRDYEAELNRSKVPAEQKTAFFNLIKAYYKDCDDLKRCFTKVAEETLLMNEDLLKTLKTVDNKPIHSEKDKDKLLSYRTLTDFGKRSIAPFFEPLLQFDTVIMDEASKATPPELILPLSFGKRSIVIGDHRQLPPMLHDKDFKEALRENGAEELADEMDRTFTDTSQFERMILNPKTSPTLIARCNIQYRMHPDINRVIKQFYLDEGGLEPAPELLAAANHPDLNQLFSRHHGLHSEGFIAPNVHTIWVNVSTPETREGTSITNEGEVKIIRKVIDLLKKATGFDAFQTHWNHIKDPFKRKQEQEIGIISFYGGQKRLLKRQLKGCGVPLKINTVDRFQGMERNIIIVSTVRSDQQTVGEKQTRRNFDSGFAKSPQRLNVALSRARRLLIVVGNKSFFEQVKDVSGNPLYKNAILEIQNLGKIIEAPFFTS
jgi:AAA domain